MECREPYKDSVRFPLFFSFDDHRLNIHHLVLHREGEGGRGDILAFGQEEGQVDHGLRLGRRVILHGAVQRALGDHVKGCGRRVHPDDLDAHAPLKIARRFQRVNRAQGYVVIVAQHALDGIAQAVEQLSRFHERVYIRAIREIRLQKQHR